MKPMHPVPVLQQPTAKSSYPPIYPAGKPQVAKQTHLKH